MTDKTVIVIGGGITGLTTAYYLQKQAREKGIPLRVLLFERDNRLGGKISTEIHEGFVMEKGPDALLARKVAALNLCRDLGLTGDIVGTNPNNKKTYILHEGKLHRIPAGLNVGIPTQFVPFATTGLLTISGKIRAAMDLLIPRSKPSGDQSLGGFLARRLGDEVVDQMAEPLLAGIYAGSTRNLSLRATYPQFEQMEKKYGSLILGMLAQAKQAKAGSAPAKSVPQPKSEEGIAPSSSGTGSPDRKPLVTTMFFGLRGGLVQMVNKLADEIGRGLIHTSTAVREIKKETDEAAGGTALYRVVTENGETFQADAVIVTTPAYDAARVLPQSFPSLVLLEKIPYVSVGNVLLAFHAADVPYPLDGTGFVVPKKEGRNITACTWISSKWMHTAPPDKVLMRCYVGRAGDEDIVDEPDESILEKVKRDLKDSMGIEAEPIFVRITRWRKAMPQYTVGHLERLAAFEKEVAKEYPGLFFTGAAYKGLGVPDCIQQGKDTAETALGYLMQ
ncbi:protoporphyrinogen oxidase [Effusibacillus lacus]|uniref:Coproporphyrinogen III oxidase n=1 Tax=Effusibacillus lacus TaxID=1348429 RepID=A0A292YBW1_9BACL|nr:protoporphyrinogen oxidase [Effusibacillus lacus]TCS74641.1 oxygen-dependent protoporphyrinogen oxidase [Effusibacillus lacus]GAX88512.1 protoporphyrinogen oxidase [Effusibacillus lacus]